MEPHTYVWGKEPKKRNPTLTCGECRNNGYHMRKHVEYMAQIYIQTYGCQMNKLDSSLICSALQKAGFDLTDDENSADVVLINTCSVREHAEQRVISHLGNLKHIKETRPSIIVGVIGCMAQRLGTELLAREEVDIVCGPAQIPRIVQLIRETIDNRRQTIDITEKIREKQDTDALEQFESSILDTHDASRTTHHVSGQAYVRAMRGCNNFCSYCVVPYVRGPEVSRPPEAIIEQIRHLSAEGVKQITLLGQTINSYRYTAGEKTYCLADLFYMISEIDGIEWIRFVTNYPYKEFFEEIMTAMRDLPKVCRYLHIPAQSGSDRILAAMNRNYTVADYLALLDKARAIVPDIAVAGDFIVGFPDESEEDFQATVELAKKAQYKNCFVFKYSTRSGTAADKRLADSVTDEVKKRRNIELLAVQQHISDKLSGQFLGRTVKVLVEGLSKKPHLNTAGSSGNPQLIGRTEGDWIVVFNGPQTLAGGFAEVKITKTSPLTLFGELISGAS